MKSLLIHSISTMFCCAALFSASACDDSEIYESTGDPEDAERPQEPEAFRQGGNDSIIVFHNATGYRTGSRAAELRHVNISGGSLDDVDVVGYAGDTLKSLVRADLLGSDGKDELVGVPLVDSRTHIELMKRNASGQFYTYHRLNIGRADRPISVGNFVGTAHDDLAVYDKIAGKLRIYANSGTGGFTLHAELDIGWHWDTIAAGRLDDDGYDDLICYSQGNGQFAMATATGTGGFVSIGDHFFTDHVWDEIVLADFQPGGRDEILLYTRNDGGVGKYLTTDGSGGLSTLHYNTTYYGAWTQFVAGDLNGDSAADLVLTGSNLHNPDTYAYYGNGTGTMFYLAEGHLAVLANGLHSFAVGNF